ncbi:MAG TPA: helix-turn-helix domain-containing protein [Kribbella sp.]|uniref:helix-turn-helix domain-containing protein n=1 Tax=Kribbella sp. TaxID=1871183 RepID=UPI002D787E59|nr:helix-turn-helix domain-containing protein [Kribbella sp.]HET6291826.1 helix-turn-helix domain-containing protein [Kribbella sp.]
MFEALSLEPADSAVYVALVGNPRASTGELATTVRLSPAQTRCALVRLTERGLVSRLPGRPVRYLAAPPDAAIGELIGAVESKLWQARDAAQALMETHRAASRYIHPEQSLEVLVGQDTIGRRVAHIENSAKTQIRGFDKPPYAGTPGANVENQGQRLRRGIRYRVIYSRSAVAWPGRLRAGLLATLREGEQARVRPDLPLKMISVDDRMAVIPISASEQTTIAYVIHPSSLLDALITLFEAEWDRGVPLSVDGPVDGASGPYEATKDLLMLLASGLTDQGIARSLGWSMRTTQRRIHALMEDLGATTRFQMVMSAKTRGWL